LLQITYKYVKKYVKAEFESCKDIIKRLNRKSAEPKDNDFWGSH